MKKIRNFTQSQAMKMDALARSMPGKIYNLSAGDPDLALCDGILKAYEGLNVSECHNYGNAGGDIKLRSLLWNDPEEVMISNGAKQSIFLALMTVCGPGDEIVIVGPCWSSYMYMCRILDIRYRLICGKEDDRYVPSPEKVCEAINGNTAAVLMNDPNNPTGAVYDSGFCGMIYEAAMKNDCWVISDEIYKDLAFKDFTSLRGKKNTIVIDGFSKSHNMTGWRMGYCISDRNVISSMTALQSQMSGCPNRLVQNILVSGWKELEKADRREYEKRTDIISRIPKFDRFRPEAGFYFYVPISENWSSSDELCEYMLKEHNIVLTSGDEYGVKDTVRHSVSSVSCADLEKILEYLKEI